MKKYFILAAAAAMMLSACSFDRDLDYGGAGTSYENAIPLTMGYTLGGMKASTAATRGNFDDAQSTSIIYEGTTTGAINNTLGIFVIKKGEKSATTGEAYERFNISSATLKPGDPTTGYDLINTVEAGKDLVYPDNKTQEIDIYAYAPKKTATISDITSNLISISSETNQTDKDKYMASDVLWGCAGTGTYVAAAAGSGGAYDNLKWESTPGSGTFDMSSANNNKITAEQYLLVKKNETVTTPTAYTALGASGRSGAYYFTLGSGTANAADVVVPMLHRGSKIVVNLFASGMELAKLQHATVKFYVDYVDGELKISDGSYVPASSATATRTAITLTDRLGIAATVTNATDAVTDEGKKSTGGASSVDYYTCSAVIVPQTNTVANGDVTTPAAANGTANLIEVELYSDNTSSATKTATYGYKTKAAATTFVSGKVYIYNITVKASGLTVTTTVQDWSEDTWGTSTTPAGGEAELQ